jgi:hypothetical protein
VNTREQQRSCCSRHKIGEKIRVANNQKNRRKGIWRQEKIGQRLAARLNPRRGHHSRGKKNGNSSRKLHAGSKPEISSIRRALLQEVNPCGCCLFPSEDKDRSLTRTGNNVKSTKIKTNGTQGRHISVGTGEIKKSITTSSRTEH